MSEPTYAAQLIRPFLRLLRADPQVPAVVVEDAEARFADQRIPVALGLELLAGAVALTGDENLGLRAARETSVGDFEVLEYVSASAATWRDALQSVLRYSKIVNGAADFRLEVRGGRAHVILDSTVPLPRVSRDYQTAAFLVAISRWQSVRPPELQVWFRHPAPADRSEYAATFGDAEVVFGAAHDGFVFDATRLETPLPSADPSLHRVLRAHADRVLAELSTGDTLAERVRAYIARAMGDGQVSAERAAASLHMSRRSLSRKLMDEDTSFTALLAEVREHTARRYLEQTDHSVEDIAFLLGFSESPPFVRAFRRWTGMPPLAYRRSRRG